MTTALPGLPERVEVYEVGPRDGLQNESTVVPVEVKAEFVRRLLDAGLRTVELTSFVPARWVPQLADAEELLARLGELPGRHPVLVPTDKGLDRALAAGVREVAVFASATETFAQRNLNRTVAESLDMFAPVVARARCEGLVEQSLAMCTSLAPLIGYDKAADVAKESFKTGKTVRQVATERKLMSDAELDRALDARKMTEPQADMIGSGGG